MTDTINETTPSLVDIIRNAVKSYLLDLHTAMPAIVISYDRTTQFAVVEPALRRTLVTGDVVELPKIYNVPVQFPHAGDTFIHYDLKEGDNVLLIFSERSIDKWAVQSGKTTPSERRMHDLNDCFAIPSVKSKPEAFEPKGKEGSIEITNKDSHLEITSDGKFVMNNGENELVSVLVELLDKMIIGKNLTGVGPLEKDPTYINDLNQVKTKLESFKL